MGIGLTSFLYKGTKPALISWDSYNGVESGRLQVDVKISESHKFSNEVTTQTMEDGTVIDEHIINNPMEIGLQFEETNNPIIAGGILGSSRASTPWIKPGPAGTFNALKTLAENKVPLTITTQHAIYENMVIKNMPILHRAPYKNAIQVSCDLIQLNFSSEETFAYKASDENTQKSASQNVNGGQQPTRYW